MLKSSSFFSVTFWGNVPSRSLSWPRFWDLFFHLLKIKRRRNCRASFPTDLHWLDREQRCTHAILSAAGSPKLPSFPSGSGSTLVIRNCLLIRCFFNWTVVSNEEINRGFHLRSNCWVRPVCCFFFPLTSYYIYHFDLMNYFSSIGLWLYIIFLPHCGVTIQKKRSFLC